MDRKYTAHEYRILSNILENRNLLVCSYELSSALDDYGHDIHFHKSQWKDSDDIAAILRQASDMMEAKKGE